MDEHDLVRLKYSKIKLIGLLAAWLAAFFTTAAVLFAGYEFVARGSWKEYMLWAVLPIFGALALYNLARLFQTHDILVVSPEGIHDTRISPLPMPWAQMEKVSRISIAGNQFCHVSLKPAFEQTLPPTRMLKLKQWLNKGHDHDGYMIHTQGLTGRLDDFWEAVMRHCPKKTLQNEARNEASKLDL